MLVAAAVVSPGGALITFRQFHRNYRSNRNRSGDLDRPTSTHFDQLLKKSPDIMLGNPTTGDGLGPARSLCVGIIRSQRSHVRHPH